MEKLKSVILLLMIPVVTTVVTTNEYTTLNLIHYNLGVANVEFERTEVWVDGDFIPGIIGIKVRPEKGMPVGSHRGLVHFGFYNDKSQYFEGRGYVAADYIEATILRSIYRNDGEDWRCTVISLVKQ